MFEEIEQKHKRLIDEAICYMKKISDKEHDITHMNDVVSYTKELLEMIEGVNKDVCVISAYWHDVGRTKISIGHEEQSAIMLKEKMKELGYEEKFIKKCYEAILYHRWDMIPNTKEGLLIKDADKLGFIGIGRWENCISNQYKLEEIIKLLPKLRNEILYFEESKQIYDREIVNLIKLFYKELYKES